MENPGSELAWSMDQDSPALVGRGSSTIRPWAVPAPPLCMVMPKPRGSVALTLGASAVLAMSMAAPRTSMESEALSEPSLVVVTLAVLSTGEVAAVAEVVPEVMCTVKEAPGARSTGPQDRTPAAMAQEGSVELSMDQLSPASVGRGSDTVTLRAVPAPELVTVMANPMGSPAETEGSSAVLAMSMEAHSTVTEAEEELSPRLPDGSLVELPEAVLKMVVQSWAVVGEVTWTWEEAPARRKVGP